MEEVRQSLCSNDSDCTEDVRPYFNANVMISHKTDLEGNSDTMLDPKLFDKGSCKNLFRKFSSFSESDDSNQNELVIDKLILKKENSRPDKHGNINKKAFCNNLKEKRQKNKDLEDSYSEDRQYLEIKQTKYLTSNQKESMHLYKEEADSSSGKEFQKSKFSRHNYLSKKVTQSKRINESNLLFMKHTDEKHIISKKQSLCFKSHVIKILNKFKELCSEYELNMEHVKWKHLKKEIMCKESASKVVNKSKSLINKLKLELDMQEKELIQFYKEWNRSCSSHNTDYEGSSSSEDETLQHKNKKEMSNDSENRSKQGSAISECDNEEIFSDETTVLQINKGKHKESQNSESFQRSKQLINDNDNENILRVTSPILGSKTQKQISNNTCTKINPKIIDSNETMLKASLNNINKQNINESIDDAFEKGTTSNTCELNNIQLKKDVITNSNDYLVKENNTESETVSNEIMIPENISPEIDSRNPLTKEEKVTSTLPINVKRISELIDNKENDDSYEVDAEEEAKKALLDSDQETPSNERCSTKKVVTSSLTHNLKGDRLKCNENEKEQKNKIQSESICKDISSDEQAELTRKENYAKLTLLDSNSDDSIDHSFNIEINNVKHDFTNSNNIRAKVKLLISSNSESSGSNSNSDSEIQMIKIDTSLNKHNKENKNTLLAEDTLSCNIGIDEKVDKRLAYSAKINNLESNKKLNMVCHVVCDRLSKTILEKHMDALEKSRQYLEYKQIKSLVNLDRLQKNQERINSQTRSNLSKKKSTVKEIKDSLLNHLEKIESNNFVEDIKQNCNSEDDKATLETRATFKTNDELMLEADRVTKNMLLNSSDSDIGDQKTVLETESHESENKDNIILTDGLKKSSQKTERKDIDEENEDKRISSKWRRNKILTTKFSSDSTSDSESDSESKKRKWVKRQQKLQEDENKSHTENSDTKDVDITHKKRNCRKIMNSDSDAIILNSNSSSDSSDSSVALGDSSIKKQQQKIRKRKTRKSDTDTSIEERRPKPKRKRIKNISTDSDDNTDNNEISNSQERKSRKNIRKVMKDKQVADDTKQAAKEEEERLKRIAERQKLYNEMYEARLANEEKVEKLVLDFDSDTKAELVSVHEDLVKRLKPHQAKGVKFMWDACFESLERAKSSPGSGCILAHCMGLGKTLQVIALTHTLLTHEKINVNTVMVVCPLSTVLNWKNEFKLWLENIEDDVTVYEMTKLKQNIERKYTLENWQKNGGVLIIGYEMFRNLTGTNKRMRKNVKEAILQSLIDPGPDVIICDEGHLLKNEDTALSKSVNRIKTLRRIVLTGTPLQNNLIEYHCMVQFIKPNLLGTKREFLNRFANPITNGQFDDSTEYDVKLMKKRAYVLHKMLKGCVQRFDYSVLTPFLPPKQEYVIFVNLTEVQINMYRYYLENFARPKRSGNGSLFTDFQVLQRIWTHPLVLQLNAEKIERMNEKRCSSDSEGSLRSFIDDSTDSSTSVNSSCDSDENNEVQATESNVISKNTKQNKTDVETVPKSEETDTKQEDWWLQFTQPEHFEDMRVSSKLVLLFGILKECEHIGDKILVFSQSLYSLTLIEKFLEKIHNETQSGTSSEYTGSWMLGLDYFRLDGQTSAENRNAWCRIFNRPSNTRARLFLISTRAGGLGINLTAANRVIIFDASWNPSHDVQSIFRIYRFGQKKPCYVYRFLASGTMEEKIYNRQVTKLSLSCRVVDEQQIERHYSNHDLSELYKFQPSTSNADKTLNLPKDRLLAEIFLKYKKYVDTYHEHDSLLENKAEEELNEEERKQAWLEYEEEKKGNRVLPNPVIFPNNALLNQHNLSTPFNMSMDYEKLQELIRKDYPNATPQYQQMMTARVLTDMYNYWEQQTYNSTNQIITQNVGAKSSRIKTQMTNVAQTSYGLHNTNVKPPSADDDIIEILPAATTNTSKGKEE